jgi:hypothetical protein
LQGQGSKVTVGLPEFFNQAFRLMKNSSEFDVLVGIDANMYGDPWNLGAAKSWHEIFLCFRRLFNNEVRCDLVVMKINYWRDILKNKIKYVVADPILLTLVQFLAHW